MGMPQTYTMPTNYGVELTAILSEDRFEQNDIAVDLRHSTFEEAVYPIVSREYMDKLNYERHLYPIYKMIGLRDANGMSYCCDVSLNEESVQLDVTKHDSIMNWLRSGMNNISDIFEILTGRFV